MAIKKIIVNGTTNMDLSADTVTEQTLLSGYTAHKSDGTQITGTYVPEDIPIYTVAYDSNYNIESITCNKTYTEVSHGNYQYAKMISIDPEYTDTYSVNIGTIYSDRVVWILYDYQPEVDLTHNMDDTIELTSPSQYALELNATANGVYTPGTAAGSYVRVNVNVPSQSPNLQSKTDINPTESSQTITPDSGYDGLSSVQINAISSTYVGSGVYRPDGLITAFTDQELLGRKTKLLRVSAQSGYYESDDSYSAPEATFNTAKSVTFDSSGNATVTFSPATHGVAYEVETYTVTKTGAVTPRTSSDLTASGATVTTPAGYYSASASKSVASGTEGTPTATKGTVSNHQVSVTPSVTNTAGYISGGTHAGTQVTVTAAELVSGSETKTANGTYDVTNLAELVVNVASSGGGLEYETGTWTPSSDIARGTISFANTHTEAPIIVALADATGTASSTTNSNHCFMYWDYYKAFGVGIPYSSSGYRYAHVTYSYRGSNTSSLSQATTVCSNNSNSTTASGTSYPRYWVNVSEFHPYTNSTSRYWRAGRTFKWIAIWKPTT